MKNSIKELLEKKKEEERILEEEQLRREERLKELTEQKKASAGKINLHPIKAVKDNKEIKQLHKEIEAYNNEKKRRQSSFVLGGIIIACIAFIGIMAIFEKPDVSSDANDSTGINKIVESQATTFEDDSEEFSKEPVDEVLNSTEVIVETSLEQLKSETETIPSSISEEASSENIVQTSNIYEYEGIRLTASDLSVTTRSDYAHIESDRIVMGNGEGATISIDTSVSDVTADDLIIIFDKEYLKVEKDVFSIGEKTRLNYYVTGKKVGESHVVIMTNYDYVIHGEDAPGYVVDFEKLNSNDGKVVYVTSSDKYHYSKDCAGENATKTTYRDAKAYDLKPCGKCAK